MSEVEWLDIFSTNLQELMRQSRLSQRDLARYSKLSEATISSYINKFKMPSVKSILAISYALGVDVSELIDFGEVIE